MTKINFLKPDISNLNTFLYIGTFLFFYKYFGCFSKFFFSNKSYWVFTK
jgi:general L-amino acid transport system permease protein